MKKDTRDIIEQCNEFLRKSSRRYSKTLKRAADDLSMYSGNFWTEGMKESYRTGKRRYYLSLNNWNVICNAIASPLSSSPWHTELKNKEDGLAQVQEGVDIIESNNDVKSAYMDAFRKDVLTGYGFCIVSTDVDEFTGEPTVVLESVKHPQSVALDPSVCTVDGSDAEEGAIVNFMSVRKARRLYGEDVVPFNYPTMTGLLSLNGMDQWNCPEDQVAVVSYYVKEGDGVTYYKICGDKVVQSATLPIKYIPIVRFAGNEIVENDQINYNGIVQQTLSLELGANIAYSTLIERCGRSVKASYLIHVSAIDGVEKSYADSDKDDAAVVLWKGDKQPVPIQEQFQTGDLQSVISTTRTLMEDTIGVPLTGIPSTTPEKTATEILRQQTSKESNTASYYQNAYTACRTISKIIIELLNGGQDLEFTLENGPAVVTRQMKARQELTALSTITPDELKPIIAKYFADTLEDDVGKDLSRNIVANLPKDLVFLEGDDNMDPLAVHQLEQMKATLEETMQQYDAVVAENAELQKQLDTAEISMMENREQRVLDWEKFQISEQNRMALETAKLEKDGAVDAAQLQLDAQKLMIEAEKNQAKARNDTDKVMLEAQKSSDAIEKAEDSGYEQGVSDGVDAAYGG